MTQIHRLVRAQLAANASAIRVRLESARARERTLPMAAQTARSRVAKEIREYQDQLESWAAVMAMARVPAELRETGTES